ncbi:hypothetical protein AMTRI_Chr06g175280 [Amborella trichopoda]
MVGGDGGKLEIFRGGRMGGRWHRFEGRIRGERVDPCKIRGHQANCLIENPS